MSRKRWVRALLVLVGIPSGAVAAEDTPRREIIDLNGTWEICESKGQTPPKAEAFTHKVPVPGLVDLARPPFADVGTGKSGEHRDVFWYRRTFRLNRDVPSRRPCGQPNGRP